MKLIDLKNNKDLVIKIINSNQVGSKFEPIVDSINGRILKFEVLLEIKEKFLNRLNISKLVFLDVLESHNLLPLLTLKHLKNTNFFIYKISKLKIGRNIKFSLNISEQDFKSELVFNEISKIPHKGKYHFEILEDIPNEF